MEYEELLDELENAMQYTSGDSSIKGQVRNLVMYDLKNDSIVKQMLSDEFIQQLYEDLASENDLENESKKSEFIKVFKEEITIDKLSEMIANIYIYKNNWYGEAVDMAIESFVDDYQSDFEYVEDDDEATEKLLDDLRGDINNAQVVLEERLDEFIPEITYTITENEDLGSLLTYVNGMDYTTDISEEVLDIAKRVGIK